MPPSRRSAPTRPSPNVMPDAMARPTLTSQVSRLSPTCARVKRQPDCSAASGPRFSIAIENLGPLAALQSGWRLTRAHVGESLLTWLVNVGLAIASGITFGLGLVGALLLLGGIGAAVFAVAGLTPPTITYIGLGGLVLVVGVLTLAGIANAFFWTYWTLAYLRLSGHAAPTAAGSTSAA